MSLGIYIGRSDCDTASDKGFFRENVKSQKYKEWNDKLDFIKINHVLPAKAAVQ